MKKDRAAYAKELIDWHFTVAPEIETVYWVNPTAPETAPIQLMEVTGSVGRPNTNGDQLEVFHFGKSDDFPHESYVAELSREEFVLFEAKVIKGLDDFGSISDAKTFKREDFSASDSFASNDESGDGK